MIIGLGHIGIDESSNPTSIALLNEVNGIDLFIDRHSHSTLQSCIEKNDSKTLLVSNGQYLNTIGCVVIDQDKKMTPYSIDVNTLKVVNIRVELLEGETAAIVDTKVGTVLVEANKKPSESLKEINLKATYTLSSNDFTIAGGDGYSMIGDDASPTLFEYGALDEILIAYLKTNPSTESLVTKVCGNGFMNGIRIRFRIQTIYKLVGN